MSLNAKFFVLIITKSGKHKYVPCNPTCKQCAGNSIYPLGSNDPIHYLGLQFNWKVWVIPKHTSTLGSMLQKLSKAPLKPHQWLKGLKTCLVPKFSHEIILGHANHKTLKKLECLGHSAGESSSDYQRILPWVTSIPMIKMKV
ncbi:hypothetical protein NXF25_008431 [Crotalus adamanteus]|uniref:Uncharacterized protein n=1 Tax=Crotalus adamanteus TaxID=8729 RepID=A0AAW1BN16_CROAD